MMVPNNIENSTAELTIFVISKVVWCAASYSKKIVYEIYNSFANY